MQSKKGKPRNKVTFEDMNDDERVQAEKEFDELLETIDPVPLKGAGCLGEDGKVRVDGKPVNEK